MNINNGILVLGVGLGGLLTVWGGCSSNGGGTTTAGTGGHTTSHTTGHGGGVTTGSMTTGSMSSSTGSMSSSTGSMSSSTGGVPFQCTVPSGNPSNGSCATTVPENDAGTGIECNPVTNAGCTAPDACDVNTDNNNNTIGFVCYSPQGTAFTDTLCMPCDNMTDATSCPAGMTCEIYDSNNNAACVRYCCSDADCAPGHCQTKDMNNMPIFGPVSTTIGLCLP